MDMYQKRKMRKEKREQNPEEDKSFTSSRIHWYPGHMAKAKRLISEKLKYIDVVFEVVDARIPYSSKIKDIDTFVKDKKKIIIMTKLDLCDKKETEKWKKYYETNDYNVLLLNLEDSENITKKVINIVNEVMAPVYEKRKEKGLQNRKTRILVVGVPNAGKSTLINRLVSKKAVKTGNKPGVTKSLDWIRINDDLELLDTPGILWPKLDSQKIAHNLASFTAIKEEILPLDSVALYILENLVKYYPNVALDRYGITEIDEDVVLTIEQVGKKRGCLSKGGVIDYDKVYSIIINDIKNGNIKNITFDKVEDYE